MERLRPSTLPASLGLLSDSAVTKHLSRGIQTGLEIPPQVALLRAAESLDETAVRWRTAPVRDLVDDAMRRFAGERTAADAWLAPRLHATLRMTRAEAADSRLWNFLALVVAPDYVVWRHRGSHASDGPGAAATSRFVGLHYTQTFARLWWAAEVFRDGPDYRPVEIACRVQDVLNTTMRLDIIDHRPTAQAILKVVERLMDAGVSRLGDRVNALSSAVNAAGSTLIYDVLAPDDGGDIDALQDWIDAAEISADVPRERLPDGPDDGQVSKEALGALLPLFEELLADAPVRKRDRARSSIAGQESGNGD